MKDYLQYKNDLDDPDLASALDEMSAWSARFSDLLFKHIEIRKGLEILDVGCGSGFPSFEIAQIFGGSCQVKGIDVWTAAIERARFKLGFYDLRNVRILEVDGARQPFSDAEFDLIVSNLGINNWSDPPAVLKECYRVAKPEAKMILTTNIKGHYREFYDVFRETLAEMGDSASLERLSASEDHRGTKESIGALLQATGWSIVKIIEDRFQMRFLDGSVMLNHSFVKIAFMEGWRSVVEPDDEKQTFNIIEGRLNESAHDEGELRMTVPMLYLEAVKST